MYFCEIAKLVSKNAQIVLFTCSFTWHPTWVSVLISFGACHAS